MKTKPEQAETCARCRTSTVVILARSTAFGWWRTKALCALCLLDVLEARV